MAIRRASVFSASVVVIFWISLGSAVGSGPCLFIGTGPLPNWRGPVKTIGGTVSHLAVKTKPVQTASLRDSEYINLLPPSRRMEFRLFLALELTVDINDPLGLNRIK